MLTKTVLASCLAATFSLTAVPSMARTVWVREAPPEARVEPAPGERHGYQWVPGYWDWRGERHVWHPGAWVRERPGHVYMQPKWVQRDGRWTLQPGSWARRDRDHDGIPNGRDRDRDGDGVPNRRDSRPNDPTRQ